jgi:hypothetical protein
MSNRLNYFLDLVWSNRVPIMLDRAGRSGKIYTLYNETYKQSSQFPKYDGTPSYTLEGLRNFLVRLSQIPAVCDTVLEDQPTLQDLYDKLSEEDVAPDDMEVVANTFYFFNRPGRTESTERVYLNVHPAFALEVLNFVVSKMVLNAARYPGIQAAKVAGPGRGGRDMIVIYLSRGLDDVLGAIADYQATAQKRAHFNFGTTRLAREILRHRDRELVGVGYGIEPAKAGQQPVSFGKSRTNVIYKVLSEVCTDTSVRGAAAMLQKQQFVVAVENAFRKERITW